jgi:hypothetical protein
MGVWAGERFRSRLARLPAHWLGRDNLAWAGNTLGVGVLPRRFARGGCDGRRVGGAVEERAASRCRVTLRGLDP